MFHCFKHYIEEFTFYLFMQVQNLASHSKRITCVLEEIIGGGGGIKQAEAKGIIFSKYYYGDQIKESEITGTCSIYYEAWKCIYFS